MTAEEYIVSQFPDLAPERVALLDAVIDTLATAGLPVRLWGPLGLDTGSAQYNDGGVVVHPLDSPKVNRAGSWIGWTCADAFDGRQGNSYIDVQVAMMGAIQAILDKAGYAVSASSYVDPGEPPEPVLVLGVPANPR